MPQRFVDDLMRDLLTEIDNRLREAERVRNQAEQHYRDRPFWPDRRRAPRDHDGGPDRDPDRDARAHHPPEAA